MTKSEQTIQAWKEEFCPVNIHHVKLEDMGAWIRRKWEGARPDALAKYGLTKMSNCYRIEDVNCTYLFNIDTCPWCIVAKKRSNAERDRADCEVGICSHCPAVVAGMRPCEDSRDGSSPYAFWCRDDDPEPMIKWVDEAIALMAKHDKEQCATLEAQRKADK